MRGVYYRTEKDGTPLATPELRISATNNRTVYYDNQNAKEAALQNDEIKEGSIVLTGYADGESEVVIKQQPDWDNAEAITTAQINAGYTVPADGLIVGNVRPGAIGDLYIRVNGVTIAKAVESSSPSYVDRLNVQCIVNKGDVLTTTMNVNAQTVVSFVPFKTAAEPLTLPVNVTTHNVPNWNGIISFTYAQANAGYVVPVDGQVFIRCSGNAATQITVNGQEIFQHNTSGGFICSVSPVVGKGDIIKYTGPSNTWAGKLVPFKN